MVDLKKCLNCEKEVKRKKNFYCSNKCQLAFQRAKRYEKFLNETLDKSANNLASVGKRYLIEVYGIKCMKCNWAEVNPFTNKIPIEMNHIDGNPENNKIDNLELLCPNCHSLSEFHKSRGKGRKWRK